MWTAGAYTHTHTHTVRRNHIGKRGSIHRFLLLFCLQLLTLPLTSHGQTQSCIVEEVGTSNFGQSSPNFCIPDPADLESFPVTTVKVNIHFILKDDGSGNFKEPGNELPGELNGVEAAQYLLDIMNDRLEDLAPYSIAPPEYYYVEDSRIRFELYSEPNNPDDPYGGVNFIYNSQIHNRTVDNFPLLSIKGSYSIYGDKVIDVL